MIAGVLEGLRAVSPSAMLYGGASTMVLLANFRNYDGELAKILGGLLMQAAVLGVMLWTAGTTVHRMLTRGARS